MKIELHSSENSHLPSAEDPKFSSSLRTLEVLGEIVGHRTSDVGHRVRDILNKMTEEVKADKSLRESFASLNSSDQEMLRGKIGCQALGELLALSQETDAELFSEALLHFGTRLKAKGRMEEAGVVFGFLAQKDSLYSDTPILQHPDTISQKAEQELNSILGKGDLGMRLEVLGNTVRQESTNWRVIAPMIAASALGASVGAWRFGRLLSRPASFLTRGLAARVRAGSAAYVAEFPVFAGLGRALTLHPQGGFDEDLGRSASSLLALRIFGFLGRRALRMLHGLNELGVATRFHSLLPATQFVIPQSSIFWGMMASHKVEEHFELRDKVDGATWVADTLGSMISLGVGSRVGHNFLGQGFAKTMQALHMVSEAEKLRIADFGMRIKNFMNIPQSAIHNPQSKHFGLHWSSSLMWMALGVGIGGGGGGSPKPAPKESISELKRLASMGSKTAFWELNERANTEPEAIPAMREALRVYRESRWAAGLDLHQKPLYQKIKSDEPAPRPRTSSIPPEPDGPPSLFRFIDRLRLSGDHDLVAMIHHVLSTRGVVSGKISLDEQINRVTGVLRDEIDPVVRSRAFMNLVIELAEMGLARRAVEIIQKAPMDPMEESIALLKIAKDLIQREKTDPIRHLDVILQIPDSHLRLTAWGIMMEKLVRFGLVEQAEAILSTHYGKNPGENPRREKGILKRALEAIKKKYGQSRGGAPGTLLALVGTGWGLATLLEAGNAGAMIRLGAASGSGHSLLFGLAGVLGLGVLAMTTWKGSEFLSYKKYLGLDPKKQAQFFQRINERKKSLGGEGAYLRFLETHPEEARPEDLTFLDSLLSNVDPSLSGGVWDVFQQVVRILVKISESHSPALPPAEQRKSLVRDIFIGQGESEIISLLKAYEKSGVAGENSLYIKYFLETLQNHHPISQVQSDAEQALTILGLGEEKRREANLALRETLELLEKKVPASSFHPEPPRVRQSISSRVPAVQYPTPETGSSEFFTFQDLRKLPPSFQDLVWKRIHERKRSLGGQTNYLRYLEEHPGQARAEDLIFLDGLLSVLDPKISFGLVYDAIRILANISRVSDQLTPVDRAVQLKSWTRRVLFGQASDEISQFPQQLAQAALRAASEAEILSIENLLNSLHTSHRSPKVQEEARRALEVLRIDKNQKWGANRALQETLEVLGKHLGKKDSKKPRGGSGGTPGILLGVVGAGWGLATLLDAGNVNAMTRFGASLGSGPGDSFSLLLGVGGALGAGFAAMALSSGSKGKGLLTLIQMIRDSRSPAALKVKALGEVGREPQSAIEEFNLYRARAFAAANQKHQGSTPVEFKHGSELGERELDVLINAIKSRRVSISHKALALAEITLNPALTPQQFQKIYTTTLDWQLPANHMVEFLGVVLQSPHVSGPMRKNLEVEIERLNDLMEIYQASSNDQGPLKESLEPIVETTKNMGRMAGEGIKPVGAALKAMIRAFKFWEDD